MFRKKRLDDVCHGKVVVDAKVVNKGDTPNLIAGHKLEAAIEQLVLQASDQVDLFLLPGVAFDRPGRLLACDRGKSCSSEGGKSRQIKQKDKKCNLQSELMAAKSTAAQQ
ncbi:uncharacterized protein LOC133737672 [Rosa rugosa]|uniref:uncharacterized protein LOC133737672 n=1 Tax=Rosa rugosa TaxID=74645 RepID=UPI002B416342|nr:uncharacterized protein LOC133737672 [Rosa rugosa]XP_062021173.1 uncharacterized protein LOC133737672 [Rosa rugosa]XP_062021175.1 uncharacterized protein LOC133737672 [Rosa rugosa]XP_062021179.1 uncharacterized protein LOC133737672 [Rosa rugosa]